MPTVLKVGAEKVKLKKGKGRIHFWRPKWGLMPFMKRSANTLCVCDPLV